METSGNIEAINNMLNVESYLGLLIDVASEQGSRIAANSDDSHEQEQVARLQERLSRRKVD